MLKSSVGIENEDKKPRWWKLSVFDKDNLVPGLMKEGATKSATFLIGDEKKPSLVGWGYIPPNVMTPAHSHDCDVIQIVLQGTMKVGNTDFGPGDVRIVPKGSAYGPTVSGPEGYITLGFFSDAQGFPNVFVREKDRVERDHEIKVAQQVANGDFSALQSASSEAAE